MLYLCHKSEQVSQTPTRRNGRAASGCNKQTTLSKEIKMKYKIESKAGEEMGIYEGATETEALAAMHRDAGYDVTVDEDDVLVFARKSDYEICGGRSDWYVKEYRNTLGHLIRAIEENNCMNDASWSDWQDEFHVQDIYGQIEYNDAELNKIAARFLKAIIKLEGDGAETALEAIELLEVTPGAY